jgi:hypothetical protein
MNIGKEQSPCIIRIQRPTPVEITKPVQEPEPATPEPATVPVRTQPAEQPAGK